MPSDIDRLSDLASAASFLADKTCSLADHADAAKAHYAAWKAASAGGKEGRYSLGEAHLQNAAKHDKIASDPESFAQKNVLAQAARKKADNGPTVGNLRAAATAAKSAASAWRSENPKTAQDSWEASSWDNQAKGWTDQADFLESKGDEGNSAQIASKLEAKLDPPAASASKEPAKASPPPPARKSDVGAFARSASRG